MLDSYLLISNSNSASTSKRTLCWQIRLDLTSSDYGQGRTTRLGRRRRVMTSSRSGTGLERSATRRPLTRREEREDPRLVHRTFRQILSKRRVGGTLSRTSVGLDLSCRLPQPRMTYAKSRIDAQHIHER